MPETRTLTCVSCPMGCALTVRMEDGRVASVTGNQCPRGVVYAEAECVNPVRTVTSTVPVAGGDLPVLPVKTASPIPKTSIMACMEELRGVRVRAPLAIGDVVVHDVAGTGVDVVATRGVGKRINN